jgi:hypothetical protein
MYDSVQLPHESGRTSLFLNQSRPDFSGGQRKPAQTSANQLCPMLKYADSATLEHFSLTASCQTGQAKSTFSVLALAGFQVATFPTRLQADGHVDSNADRFTTNRIPTSTRRCQWCCGIGQGKVFDMSRDWDSLQASVILYPFRENGPSMQAATGSSNHDASAETQR